MKKCIFGKKRINYLRYVVSNKRVKVDEKKVKTMKEWPKLTNIHKVRGFLELCNYYSNFVHKFADLALPLTNTLIKDRDWKWRDKEQEIFEKLKETMQTTLVLVLLNLEKDHHVETDCLDFAREVVLLQKKRKSGI
jgi:RNase H-like domain found in reverse transcriptase